MNNDTVTAAHHLDGLERIVNLRGGFETLDHDFQAYISWLVAEVTFNRFYRGLL